MPPAEMLSPTMSIRRASGAGGKKLPPAPAAKPKKEGVRPAAASACE
jgi:hypothetical protein